MAIIVVSDTSPIRALHHLGLLSLCRQLYGCVVVPQAVREELLRAASGRPAIDIVGLPGFEIKSPRLHPDEAGVPSDLDTGETEAITLAVKLHADMLLIDERKGTDTARRLGLTTIGVFGVLLDAKRKGLLETVLPCVDRLETELRFFISPSVRRRLMDLAGE